MADIVEELVLAFDKYATDVFKAARDDTDPPDVDDMAAPFATEITTLRTQLAEAREALDALVAKLDIIGPATSGVFVMAKIHGCEYDGPTWVEEIARAHATLERIKEPGAILGGEPQP